MTTVIRRRGISEDAGDLMAAWYAHGGSENDLLWMARQIALPRAISSLDDLNTAQVSALLEVLRIELSPMHEGSESEDRTPPGKDNVD